MTTNPNIDLENAISLRVHFQLESEKSDEQIVEAALLLQQEKKPDCTVKIVDDHIWLGIPKKHQKLYSPNLHIELNKNEQGKSIINAKFGPDPALWTLFMFLHFVLAIASIALIVVAYANYALDKSFTFQVSLLVLFLLVWIGLYIFARINRHRGIHQAKMLLQKVKGIL